MDRGGFEGGPVGERAPTGEEKQRIEAEAAASARLNEASENLARNPDDEQAAKAIQRNAELKRRLAQN